MKEVLAVDLGGTKMAIARVAEDGALTRRMQWPAEHSLDATVARIAEQALDGPRPDAIGVTVPGISDRHTGQAWAPNLWGDLWVPLHDAIAKVTGLPVVVMGDRAAYVLGECWLGVARGCADAVFVAVGTGIGVGIVAGGRVVDGAHGIAGAAGWMTLARDWRPEYARCGCWDAEAAGPATAAHAGMETAEAVVAAARAGDEAARAALAHTAIYLGAGIANLVSLLDPEMVVLGGGLMAAGDLLIDGIRTEMARWAQPIAGRRVRIEFSQLGDSAGLAGAATMAFGECCIPG
jgi:glucokinase